MPIISEVFTVIFFHQFTCFRTAEAHLDVRPICPQNGIFYDVTIKLAIFSEK